MKIQEEITYMNQRHWMQRHIEDLFVQSGYIPIEPPYFEDYDDFRDINKRIKKESMVKVLKGDGDVLILRPDITTSIIRSLMPRWEKDLKLKLFYYSTVFKNIPNASIRELKQIGVEYLGEASFSADWEVIQLALNVLKKYEDKFILEVGTSRYLNGLLKEINLKTQEEKELKTLLYNKDASGLKSFMEELSLKKDRKDVLYHLLDFQGTLEEILEKSREFYSNEEMRSALEELQELHKSIEAKGSLSNTYFDLSLVTTFDYYEGIIFKGYYPKVYRPILSGGRYDPLTERFGEKVSAVGFSIDVNELMKVVYREEEACGLSNHCSC